MPLLVQVGDKRDRAGFDVLISASGYIEFLDYPFDIEAEEALEALGGGRSMAFDFYDVFEQGGIAALLNDNLFGNDVFLAIVNQYYEAYGDEKRVYALSEFRSDLISALKMAFVDEDRFKTKMLAKIIDHFNRVYGGLDADIVEEPTDYVDPYFPVRSTVCVLQTLTIGGTPVKTWSSCGYRLITDQIALRPFPRAEYYNGGYRLWQELGAEEAGDEVNDALVALGFEDMGLASEFVPDVPDWEIPQKVLNGPWYVIFVAAFEQGQIESRSARYATYEDAREAALLGLMVIENVRHMDYGGKHPAFWIAYDPARVSSDMEELDTKGYMFTDDPRFRRLVYVEYLKPDV